MGNFNLSRLALKIVVMTREQGTGYREQVTGYREEVTRNRLQGRGYRLQGTGNREQVSKSYFFTEIKSIHNY
ncbi:MAG: hypothetical protein ACOVQ3_18835 [Dolichospermum sp.]|jgi:hypothetical protein